MSRIVAVYSDQLRSARLVEMGFIRWYRLSAALAKLGHTVDIASAELRWRLWRPPEPRTGEPKIVPLARVRWDEYDVVKTLFHRGFETLERYGGAQHPFIISKLGSVVGPRDMPGIYFYGRARAAMFRLQERIHSASKYVTLLSRPAAELWRDCFGGAAQVLLVPGGVDAEIPAPRPNPYPADGRLPSVFAGNFYSRNRSSQSEAHLALAGKLNQLGALLEQRGVRLYVVGPGAGRSLDRRCVTWCGPVSYHESWTYLHHAAVGVVVAAGPFMHNNESTKIYHYLRAGLPVVGEAGFPNDPVVTESGLGFLVRNGDMVEMAERVVEAARRTWDRAAAIDYILQHHTWEKRAAIYDRILSQSAHAPTAAGASG